MSRVLLVASPGGHLDELALLVEGLGLAGDDLWWVSSRNEHTESLLAERQVVWVPPVASRQLIRAVRGVPAAMRLHRRLRPDLVLSTGAALAVPHLLAAAAHRTRTMFVDSVTRREQPSLSGKIAQRLPGVTTYTQSATWSRPGWLRVADVFSAFASEQLPELSGAPQVSSALVTLGQERFGFPRAVDAAERVLDGHQIAWQVGNTDSTHERWLPADQLRAEASRVDVVLTHAGVGSVLMALSAGKVPVVLPREGSRGEHVDEHQGELATMLQELGLAVVANPDELSMADLERAAARRVVRRPGVAGVVIDSGSRTSTAAEKSGR